MRKSAVLFSVFGMLLCFGMWASSPTAEAADKPAAAGAAGEQNATGTNADAGDMSPPVAVIPEKNFRFEPVLEGTTVRHDFVIKNSGKTALNISKVKTS